MVKRVVKDVVRYCINAISCFLIYSLLNAYGLIEAFAQDLVPCLNLENCIVLLGIGNAIFFIWIICNKKMSDFHIWLIKYKFVLYAGMYVVGVIFLKKTINGYKALGEIFFELLFTYIFIEYETTRIFKYDYAVAKELVSNYEEKPIVGRENLTKVQLKALEQLIKVLDDRKASDSFNVALIGAWGSGKSSITDTLTLELQLRKSEKPRYFILKISAQTIRSTKNVVGYVKNYLYTLMKKYGIVGIDKTSSIAFLSTLSDMLEDTNATINFSSIMSKADENSFSDIENERTLFASQIQKLLAVSHRKNIVFIIDDADRTEIKEDVLCLLSEFSSINGLITIILLNTQESMNLQPKGNDNIVGKEDNDEYDALDKYVHVRIKIENHQHIEYENSIKSQILLECNNLKREERCYINCLSENMRASMFVPFQSIPTSIMVSPNSIISNNNSSIMTEIFLENLKYSKDGFGKYFEDTIMEYMHYSKELWPHIWKLLSNKQENWDIVDFQIYAMWTGGVINDEHYDWLAKLFNNSNQYFYMLLNLVEAAKMASKEQEIVQCDISCVEDLYDFYMIKKELMPERKWENRNEKPVSYPSLDGLITLMFSKEENDVIKKLLLEHNYQKVEEILKEKTKNMGNFFAAMSVFDDFMRYVRKIMNNYRTFKMQLREAELLNINYLDYLICEWHPTQRVEEMIEQIKNQTGIGEEIVINTPQLSSLITMIFYSKYIVFYGRRFMKDELKDRKLWIYRENEMFYIVLTRKENNMYDSIILDATGNVIAKCPEEVIRKIRNKANEIFE